MLHWSTFHSGLSGLEWARIVATTENRKKKNRIVQYYPHHKLLFPGQCFFILLLANGFFDRFFMRGNN
jgi:hypothetical protein